MDKADNYEIIELRTYVESNYTKFSEYNEFKNNID